MSVPGSGRGRAPRGVEQLDAAVRHLTGEVVRLGHDTAAARDLAEQASRAAATLAEAVAGLAAAGQAEGDTEEPDAAPGYPPTWWDVDDPVTAARMLDELRVWLETVYVRYPGGRLPDCWAWHPSVVAELWALRDAWRAVHYGKTASPAGRMDWHERWRPGVTRRVGDELRHCGLDKHTPDQLPRWRPPRVGGGAQLGDLATWWAQTGGNQYPPAPTPDLLAQENGGRPVDRY